LFPNLRAAFNYYEKACELSEANGCGSLGGYYEQGFGVAADTFRAQHYYERACSLGRGESCADRDRMARVNSAKDVHLYIHHRR
jgi:TPR repeat protein